MEPRRWIVLTLAVSTLCGCGGRSARPALLETDFERFPGGQGWQYRRGAGEAVHGAWSDRHAASGTHAIRVGAGYSWQSPHLPVEQGASYLVRFRARAPRPGWVGVEFFDGYGGRLQADHWDSIDPAGDWADHALCVPAKVGAKTMRIRFTVQRPSLPRRSAALYVDDVSVRRVNDREVLAWADALYATMPPLKFVPPANRGKRIGRTMAKLRRGRPVRIVLLGDSLANDLGNSPVAALLGRRAPGRGVEFITAVRNGGTCGFYRRPGMVRLYALRHKPDLVAIMGLGIGTPDDLRDVIRQVRAGGAEVMVISAPFGFPRSKRPHGLERHVPAGHRNVAAEEDVEYFDAYPPVEAYIARSGRPRNSFMRDEVHANVRGKQIMARIMARYFAP